MSKSPWFACLKANPERRMRLFCLPYAGGAAQAYRSWQDRLAPAVEVYPIQPPGRWMRLSEPPLTRVSALVDGIIGAMEPLLDLPYAIYGHSLGAIVAFELTRTLRARGAAMPQHLMVGSRTAPHVEQDLAPVHALPEEQLVEALETRYGGIPAQVKENRELLELVLPATRADLQAFETYEYEQGEPLDCAVSAFGADGDKTNTREGIERWRDLTTGDFALQMFEGGHLFFVDDSGPLLDAIAKRLGV